MKAFIILERTWEYSDCYFDRDDAKQWVNSVFLDQGKAEIECLNKNIEWLFDEDFKTKLCYYNEDVNRPLLLAALKEEGFFNEVKSLWGGDEEIQASITKLLSSSYLENHHLDQIKHSITKLCGLRGIYKYEILEVEVE